MDDLRIERILRVVEAIPSGRAATYQSIGQVVGEVPRVVGWVMHRWGHQMCWWRVCNAQGTIPGHAERALDHWVEEGLLTAGTAGGSGPSGRSAPRADAARVDLARVGVEAEELERLSRDRLAELPAE